MKNSFIFLADGFEEIEALSVVDVMRRAGIEITTVSIMEWAEVTGAHGIKVVADRKFDECDFADCDWLILPGGMPGATNLHEYEPLSNLLKAHTGHIAAICAAPAVVLAPLGVLAGKEATCYPGFEALCIANGAIMKDQRVVKAGNVITANGPASATRFALAIVKATLGHEAAEEVGSGMLHYDKADPYYF